MVERSRGKLETDERKFRSKRNDQNKPHGSKFRASGRKKFPDKEEKLQPGKETNSRYEGKPDTSKPVSGTSRYFKGTEGEKKSPIRRKQAGSKFDKGDNPEREALRKSHYSKKKQLEHQLNQVPEDGMFRINKFIANTGLCSRREADKYIKEGKITVNGKVVSEVGTKVNLRDDVRLEGKRLNPERKVYLVLNKPKDFVTTMDDPIGRKTVMNLVKNACRERVYPVGRLDRMSTGVLLFTNDGELTKKLTHPKYNKKKIYHVFLDKPLHREDLQRIAEGLELEDGFIKVDAISYTGDDKRQAGVEIHSGKKRIVRRIFEHVGYEVEKLDRVYFAGITKKNLPRGRWRFLTPKEISMLTNY